MPSWCFRTVTQNIKIPSTFFSFWFQEQVQFLTVSFTNPLQHPSSTGPALNTDDNACGHVCSDKFWMDGIFFRNTTSSGLFLHNKSNIPIFPEEILYKGWKQLLSIIVKINLLFSGIFIVAFSSPIFKRGCYNVSYVRICSYMSIVHKTKHNQRLHISS